MQARRPRRLRNRQQKKKGTARPSNSDIPVIQKTFKMRGCSARSEFKLSNRNKTSLLPLHRNGTAAHKHAHVARDLVPDRFDVAPSWHAGLGVRPLVVVVETDDELAEQRSKVVVVARKERLDLVERLGTRVRERKLLVISLVVRRRDPRAVRDEPALALLVHLREEVRDGTCAKHHRRTRYQRNIGDTTSYHLRMHEGCARVTGSGRRDLRPAPPGCSTTS